jgi:hypothetical protein
MFHYLMMREELEYHLPSDKDDPRIPGCCYRAPAQSRWNTPEKAAIFSDVVREISVLQTTDAMFRRDGGKWVVDMKLIANATVADFEKLQTILARRVQQSIPEMTRLAGKHKLLPLFKALQCLTFQIGNVPLTQGCKVSLRQLGFALNIYDGPLTVFLITNFADTYSPITVTLIDAAGEPLGAREVNLLQSVPGVPTLQAMRRALAKHLVIQARLFLVRDDLVHAELLCVKAWIGKKKYGRRGEEPLREYDFASSRERRCTFPSRSSEATGSARPRLHTWTRKSNFSASGKSSATQ